IPAARSTGALIFGGGVDHDDEGRPVTAGGRVLTVVGQGSDVPAAADAAYAAAAHVEFAGKYTRPDIGRAAVSGRPAVGAAA
ncbi:MAG: phosphoribosylamine--glycine ligase, partial [Chloroflexota bacterium]|nr:phosphoribosylamine--glycine ligase [Chloroflexota bacterium]